MEHYTLHEIVKKQIGPIDPVAETTQDNERYLNLQKTCALIERLLMDVKDVADKKGRHEYSVKRAGQYAHDFLSINVKGIEDE